MWLQCHCPLLRGYSPRAFLVESVSHAAGAKPKDGPTVPYPPIGANSFFLSIKSWGANEYRRIYKRLPLL